MKKSKIALALCCATLTASLFGGCGKKKDSKDDAVINYTPVATMTDADNLQVVSKEGCVINEFTGEWIDESLKDQRPVCIMINNIVDAMPQSGISNADVTFEMLVEGGITRYMCVFKDPSNMEKLGPVRSARHYYIAVADMLDGIYCHVGWSMYAEDHIKVWGTNNLNGLYDTTTYFRDNNRVAPHNCYTSSENLEKGIAEAGYSRTYRESDRTNMFAFNYEDADLGNGTTAKKITTDFGNGSTRWYEYNADEKLYYRFQYGEKQIDDQINEQLKYKNVMVIFVNYKDLGEGLLDVDWNNGGSGYYATNGEYESITWKSESGTLQFYTEDGNQLKMNPGKTFVTVFPESKSSGIKFE